MSLGFSISEGFKGIFKARLAMTMSISSITLSILMIGLFFIFGMNLQSWIGLVREKIDVELIIEFGTTDKEIEELMSRIKDVEGISSIELIPKEKAPERFKEDFGQDVLEVLEYNPFPASVIVEIKDDYRNTVEISKLKNKLELFLHVDEVVYNEPLLEKINQAIDIIFILASLLGLIVTIITIGLIYNTIRLTIYARRDMIHIMRLVGATESFIKRPFLVEGVIQGIVGALISSGIIFYGIKLIKFYIYPYVEYHPIVFVALLIFGMVIGFLSAHMSVGKYLKIT
jgi:cell division transport system permease protein